ncbi:MAG TPA: hypothetical protein PLB16_12405 [bacterium]|nr:hypothetical protein [bacterium]
MKVVIFMVLGFFLVSCGEDSFEKAEMSDCLTNLQPKNIIQPKVEITEESDEMVSPDNETDDSDFVEEELDRAVILIEKTKTNISFYYQDLFACDGFEHGYEIEPDSSDITQLILYPKSKDIWPNENVKCVCPKKMTVEYSNESQDLTKVGKIKTVYDDYETTLEF